MRVQTIYALVALFGMLFNQLALATDDRLQAIQRDWAIANYQFNGKQKEEALLQLLATTEAAVSSNPEAAQYWIWDGIVKSSYAGAKGGLKALSYVKESRRSLEKALQIEDTALQGSAYTSLGVLYYKAPGWPISFGSDKKARQFLQQALELNPDGIDPNYFYAEFLIQTGAPEQATGHLRKALSAPPRPGRELADAGRKNEIRAVLASLSKQHN